jgi:tRNA pseudouridine55 synthase
MKPLVGLLVVDKPSGMTSRRAVDQVVKFVRPAKVGHAGTLDPLATGVLVLGIGPAVRLVEYVQQGEKRYVATFELGASSPTDDVDGDVTRIPNPPIPSREQIEHALPHFCGNIMQRPPDFAAVKVQGRRAYELAREGEEVNLVPRPVTVYELNLLDYSYPRLELGIRCGRGTYVRSIGRDLAESLGTSAVMSALSRKAIGPFELSKAVPVADISRESIEANLLPLSAATFGLPKLSLSPEEITRVQHGLVIERTDCAPDVTYAGLGASEELVAILQTKQPGSLRPVKCFSVPEQSLPPPRGRIV